MEFRRRLVPAVGSCGPHDGYPGSLSASGVGDGDGDGEGEADGDLFFDIESTEHNINRIIEKKRTKIYRKNWTKTYESSSMAICDCRLLIFTFRRPEMPVLPDCGSDPEGTEDDAPVV